VVLQLLVVPLNNTFLYLDDDKKWPVLQQELWSMKEVSSIISLLYTIILHALLFLPCIPLSLFYHSTIGDPHYIWEWYCGSISGYLRPTPSWFITVARVMGWTVLLVLVILFWEL